MLGINSQIHTTSGGGEGVGYAIPVDTVRRTLAALRRDGSVQYAYLGVATARIYPQLARRFGLPVTKGAWVQDVVADGPADNAGLIGGSEPTRFQARSVSAGGDIIAAVDGLPLDDEGVARGRAAALQAGRRGRPAGVPKRQAARRQGRARQPPAAGRQRRAAVARPRVR